MNSVRKTINFVRLASQNLKYTLARKVIIGAANTSYPGWLVTDKFLLDITNRDTFTRFWQPNLVWRFLAEHVWEHLTEEEAKKANANCFEFLKVGGRLRIAVPDGFHPDPKYIESVEPGGSGLGSDDHKILYNYKSLSNSLERHGFKVEFLEYWDERGQFHYQKWLSKDGHIVRSKRYDPRNQDGSLTYTSLIIDAIKPYAPHTYYY
jgi:predicted SAM-dependent methyltransferase